jgi:hypothetical protein
LSGLARQRRQALDLLSVGDQHIPTKLLQRVVNEACAGHRLDDAAHRLAALQHPARQSTNAVGIAGRGELRDQLTLLREQTNIDTVAT